MSLKTINLHVRLDEKTAELLNRLAEKEHESVSSYIRRLLWKQVKPDMRDVLKETSSFMG